jgi:hypothetical protein
MAAKDALRSEQLAMFIPAKDIIQASPLPGDKHYTEESSFTKKETNQELWDRKLDESTYHNADTTSDQLTTDIYGISLHGSIASEGVKEPVRLMWDGREVPTVAQGHHRIAAAHNIDPEMLVPVMHYDDDEYLADIIHGENHYTLGNLPREEIKSSEPPKAQKRAARRKD